MKYFQTDDRDDYFASLGTSKPSKPKPLFRISKDGNAILDKTPPHRAITFTKTLINKSRKELSESKWKRELEALGYEVVKLQ